MQNASKGFSLHCNTQSANLPQGKGITEIQILTNLTDCVKAEGFWPTGACRRWSVREGVQVHTEHIFFFFMLDRVFLFICMSADFASTPEEIRPVDDTCLVLAMKKDYITPCTSKQMSLSLSSSNLLEVKKTSLRMLFCCGWIVNMCCVKGKEWSERWQVSEGTTDGMEGEWTGFCRLSLNWLYLSLG